MEEIDIIICLRKKKLKENQKIIMRLRILNLVINKIVFEYIKLNNVRNDLVMHY